MLEALTGLWSCGRLGKDELTICYLSRISGLLKIYQNLIVIGLVGADGQFPRN